MSILIVILVLSLLIIVHELGHFLAAKRTGVKVEKFSLGFGPRLMKLNFKGTEYSISAIRFLYMHPFICQISAAATAPIADSTAITASKGRS